MKRFFYFFVKMGGTTVCYLNKYTTKSINSPDLIEARYIHFHQNVDWPGETHNGREVSVRSVNPKYHGSIFGLI